jgi:hypothetical protein
MKMTILLAPGVSNFPKAFCGSAGIGPLQRKRRQRLNFRPGHGPHLDKKQYS